MNFSRNKIWLLPLVVVLLYPLWGEFVKDFLSVKVENMDIVRQITDQENPQFQMENFTLYQTSGGNLQLKLVAESVLSGDPGTSEYRLKGVVSTLYDADNRETLITGGEALYVARQKLLTMVDNVVVDRNNGEFTLETEALRYYTAYKVVKTATPLVLRNNEATISGNSLMYNMQTGAFRVTGDVMCEF